MSESATRKELFTLISAVSGIGKVYDYERWAADWGTFIKLFQDPASKRILGWEIMRSASPAKRLNNVEEERTHTYTIKGYMGVEDAAATEKQFTTLIERLRDQVGGKITLNGSCDYATAVAVRVQDCRTFGSVLCHYAELEISAITIL